MADDIKIVIGADASGATKEMARAQAALKSLNTAATAIGGALAGAMTAFGAMMKRNIDTADELAKMSQRIGISVRDLAGLKHAADLSGTSLEGLATGVKRFSAFMAQNGNALKQVGITASDSMGALMQIADQFARMPDGAEKTALAMKLFGRSGADMIPLLNGGSAALREMIEEGQRLFPVTDESARAAEKLNDSFTRLKAELNALVVEFMPPFVNALQGIIDDFNEGRKAAGGFLEAIRLFGLEIDPFKSLRENIATVQEDLDKLRKAKQEAGQLGAAVQGFGFLAPSRIDALIADRQKQLAFLSAKQQRQFGWLGVARDLQAQASTATAQLGKLLDKAKSAAVARLPRLADVFDAELAGLKSSLKTAEDVIEASYKARLITEDAYWQAKAETRRRALDLEERDLREKLAAQQDLLAKLSAVKPKDANQQADVADRMLQARNKIAELQAQLDALDGRRVVVDLEIQADRAKLDKELADIKAKLEQEFAQATGAETPEMRIAAIRREYDDLLARFGNDPRLVELVDKLVPVKAAQANLADLERQWSLALERMRNAEQSANIQAQQGLITTSEAQAKIAEAHNQAAAAMEDLLPKMREAANVLGPEAQAKVEAFKVALMEVKDVADPVAASLNTSIKNAFEDMFVSIGNGAKTAKDAFLDFARSVIAAIQRIFAQKLAEQLFGAMGKGGGIGDWIVKGLGALGIKFASGGQVPGSGTGDTVPALLTPGEFVIRRDVARRIGYDLLAAINGGLNPPRVIGRELAFAAGGLVPQVTVPPAQPQVSQSVRIVNAIDPSVTHDHLQTPAGERVIVNIIGRNARAVRAALQG